MAAFEDVKKSIFLLNLSDTEIYTEKKYDLYQRNKCEIKEMAGKLI